MNARNMFGVEEMADKIASGGWFFLAGDEAALRRLPPGNWIGGTTPYFMTEEGGADTRDRVYALELPSYAAGAEIKIYDNGSLADVYKDGPDNGFSLIIIPASSKTHLSFALEAPGYRDFASRPLLGWISGVPLGELGRTAPLVFDGRTGTALADGAAVIHVSLPRGRRAEIGIVNIFEPSDGDRLTFADSGFSASEVLVNGRPRGFADYIAEKGLDTKLPLVADYGGTMINVSFQAVDAAAGRVSFYAPVFKGVEYRHAKPVGAYVDTFLAQKPEGVEDRLVFSCNCILNYLYAGLEGKRTAGFYGPITFGEIGYQLLNQTAVYLEITSVNLAERLRAATARQQQYQLLETLMDTIPNPVYYKDTAGRYLGCNKAYAEFAGRPKEEIPGRETGDIFPPAAAELYSAKDRELFSKPGSQTFELDMPGKAGEPRHLVVHKATFSSPGGRVGGLVGVIFDVTEHILAMERLAAAHEELKGAQARLVQSEKMSAVGQLAAGVAHEINNPLGIILGFAQGLASRAKADDPALMPLRSIEREVLRCKNLVQELLVFSRSSQMQEELVDISEAVQAALALVAARARMQGVEMVRELPAGLPRVPASRLKIQQAIINLANNALDAMPGGGALTVSMSLPEERPGYVRIRVGDTGTGIPREIQGKILEPFFTTKEPGKGTGLGLSLVYEIVKKHNGMLEFGSAPGRGAEFLVFLPITAAELPAGK